MPKKKGYKAAKATADKLKGEAKEKEKVALAVKESLMAVKKDETLSELYKQSARMGIDNLGGESTPQLKVYQAGKSEAELSDGSDPNNGWFFYTADQTQYETAIVHILSVSRGFYTPALNDDEKKKYNQLVGGVLMNDPDNPRPFIMWLNGLKLNPFWTFSREVLNPYTHNKDLPVPMFAMRVRMTTKQEKHEYGKSWVIQFELAGDEGEPEVITDEGMFMYLRDHVETMEQAMDAIIESKEKGEPKDDVPHPAEVVDGPEEIFG